MEQCKNCNGVGLIGNGPVPTDLAGEKKTCPDCSGTGIEQNPTAPVMPSPEPEAGQPVQEEPQQAEGGEKKDGDTSEDSSVDSDSSGNGVDSTLE